MGSLFLFFALAINDEFVTFVNSLYFDEVFKTFPVLTSFLIREYRTELGVKAEIKKMGNKSEPLSGVQPGQQAAQPPAHCGARRTFASTLF